MYVRHLFSCVRRRRRQRRRRSTTSPRGWPRHRSVVRGTTRIGRVSNPPHVRCPALQAQLLEVPAPPTTPVARKEDLARIEELTAQVHTAVMPRGHNQRAHGGLKSLCVCVCVCVCCVVSFVVSARRCRRCSSSWRGRSKRWRSPSSPRPRPRSWRPRRRLRHRRRPQAATATAATATPRRRRRGRKSWRGRRRSCSRRRSAWRRWKPSACGWSATRKRCRAPSRPPSTRLTAAG